MVIRSVLISVSCIFLFSCASGKFGINDNQFGNQFDKLKGKTKSQIVKTFGMPDKQMVIGDTEYWSYKWQHGVYIFVIGSISESEYVLIFNNDKLISYENIDIGDNVGLLMVPGAITR